MTDFTNVTVLDFNTLGWAYPSMRKRILKEGFGARGSTYVYLPGRGPFVIHCRTGSKPERSVRLSARVSFNSFGASRIQPVFAESLEALVGLAFGNMFLSNDGTDQWPPKDHYTGLPNPRSADHALKANIDYYFMVPTYEGGHYSILGRESTKISYVSTHSDDVEELTLANVGEPMIHHTTGEPGMWYPLDD